MNKLNKIVTSMARAYAANEKSTNKFVMQCLEAGIKPTAFLSPNDKQGNPDKNTKSTSTAEEYREIVLAFATGLGNCRSGLEVKTHKELVELDVSELTSRAKAYKEDIKAATKDAGKRAIAKLSEKLSQTKKARTDTLRVISGQLRDKALVLVTAYSNLAKAEALAEGKTTKQAEKAKQAEKDRQLKAMGKATKKDKKPTNEVVIQHATNLYNSIEKAPVEGLSAKEFNQLAALLVKIVGA